MSTITSSAPAKPAATEEMEAGAEVLLRDLKEQGV